MELSAFIHKLFYAILLSPLQTGQLNSARLSSVPFRKKSGSGRVISAVNFIDRSIPGIASKISRSLYHNNFFPWAPVDIQLIAFGTGAAVFRIFWKGEDNVLRIYRKSVGRSRSGLLEIAAHYKGNYEMMISWYGNSPGLVPPMEFLILEGMPLIGPVAASLQPYIHGEKQDLFEDYTDDELMELFSKNDFVREQFIYFAQQTIYQWNERKTCFDFLGRQNLMLVTHAGDCRLRLPDCGFFKFDILAKKFPETIARFEQRMNRLVSLYEMTKGFHPAFPELEDTIFNNVER